MAIVSKEELLKQIKTLLGDNTSDEALKLIEDATDTLDANKGGEDVEKLNKRITELEEEKKLLDESWRTKYRERFFSAEPTEKDPPVDPSESTPKEEDEDEAPKHFEDLFSTEN